MRLGLGEDAVVSGDQNHARLSHLCLVSCRMSPVYRGKLKHMTVVWTRYDEVREQGRP